jgi:hypothetical protein
MDSVPIHHGFSRTLFARLKLQLLPQVAHDEPGWLRLRIQIIHKFEPPVSKCKGLCVCGQNLYTPRRILPGTQTNVALYHDYIIYYHIKKI